MTDTPTVLWVDNDLAFLWPYTEALRDAGYRVLVADSVSEARNVVSTEPRLDLAILDVMMPLVTHDTAEDVAESHGGYRSGLLVGRYIRENRLDLPFVGLSVRMDREIKSWFEQHGAGFATKYELSDPDDLVRFVASKMRRSVLAGASAIDALPDRMASLGHKNRAHTPAPVVAGEHKVFIVHGRNHSVRDRIDLFLTKELRLSTVVMEAGAHSGRTLPEKFEQMAHEAAFAVLILSADDHLLDKSDNRELKRARQNVVLEVGFFWGLLGRAGGVALLVEGDPLMELPSDVQGLGWIPITDDLGETKRLLMRELQAARLVG